MNNNLSISPNTLRTIKSEPRDDHITRFKSDLVQQKGEHEQVMQQLQKQHDEQICKLCYELEKSSALLHQYKLELDAMRLALNSKDKQINQKNNQLSFHSNLQTKSMELNDENTKLKHDLAVLTIKYQTVVNEMQDARQYILKMIASLE